MLRHSISLSLLLLASSSIHADRPSPLPATFIRAAQRALRGHYGRLLPWQRQLYQQALRGQVISAGQAWVTSYYPQEGFFFGKPTRSGRGVSRRSAAVASYRWPQWRDCLIWTAAYGLRRIEDTGANSNERIARRKGADIWVDYWFPQPHPENPITDYIIIKTRRASR